MSKQEDQDKDVFLRAYPCEGGWIRIYCLVDGEVVVDEMFDKNDLVDALYSIADTLSEGGQWVLANDDADMTLS